MNVLNVKYEHNECNECHECIEHNECIECKVWTKYQHSFSISFHLGETWIDVSNADANPDFTRLRGFFPSINPIANSASDAGKTAHFISETGILDVFLYPGPRPAQVSSQFARTVGTPALPPVFALGYHQCRWNYKDEEDVSFVDKEMDASGFPFDVLW